VVNRLFGLLTLLLVGLVALVAAGPTVVAILHALVPLTLVVAVAVAFIRAVFFFTNRW
jgi:hypothetical protein